MRYIPRILSKRLKQYMETFPIVAVIGPRQSGKTTFARNVLASWQYFDTERSSDYNRITGDVEFFLNEYGQECIIDEAQEVPALFPALRSYVDRNKSNKCRIVLLGSVNPLLVKNISESLAGRVGFLELTPFLYTEIIKPFKISIEKFWFSGGFPKLIVSKRQPQGVWLENYIKTFVERDALRHLQTSLSPQKQTQLLTMIAHMHGKSWNASQIAGAFGVSYHTVNRYVDMMEQYFLVRRLQPLHANIGKRLIKQPKLFFRDTGILHQLLGISSIELLRSSPYRGFSFEGFVIEQLIQKTLLTSNTQAHFYFYRTSQGDEIDLLIKKGAKIEAYEIKAATNVSHKDLSGFVRCLDQLQINRGNVIYFGKKDYRMNARIDVKSVKSLRDTSY
ncbi:MAG: ATP-binding protein, partial [bacterium]